MSQGDRVVATLVDRKALEARARAAAAKRDSRGLMGNRGSVPRLAKLAFDESAFGGGSCKRRKGWTAYAVLLQKPTARFLRTSIFRMVSLEPSSYRVVTSLHCRQRAASGAMRAHSILSIGGGLICWDMSCQRYQGRPRSGPLRRSAKTPCQPTVTQPCAARFGRKARSRMAGRGAAGGDNSTGGRGRLCGQAALGLDLATWVAIASIRAGDRQS